MDTTEIYANATTMTPADVEFLAEETLITIIPNFKYRKFHFIGGDFGPLEPSMPIQVPMWLAIYLRANHKCRIQRPDWLEKDKIAKLLDEEKENASFVELPFHYLEIASLLLNNNGEGSPAVDIPDAQVIRTLIADLHEVRQKKIRKGVQMVAEQAAEGELPNAIKMNNVSAMEINAIRTHFTTTLDRFRMFNLQEDKAAGGRRGDDGGVFAGAQAGTEASEDNDEQAPSSRGFSRKIRRFRR